MVLLDDPHVVDNTAVVGLGELGGVSLDLLPVQVRGVVHEEPGVSEGVRSERTPRRLLPVEGLVHLVGSGGPGDDVHRGRGVLGGLGGLALVHGVRPLVVVLVAVDEEVDSELHEDRLHLQANPPCRDPAILIAGAIDAAVPVHHNPRHVLPVRLGPGEILLEPLQEGKHVDLQVPHQAPQLRGHRHVMNQPVIPAEVQRVRGLPVLAVEQRRLRVGRLAPKSLDVVGQLLVGVLVVPVAHHVRHLGRELFDVAHEVIACGATVAVEVVAEITHVGHDVGLFRLEDQAVLLPGTGRGVTDLAVSRTSLADRKSTR
mmetsp:Transcript_24291/g.61847  ORF Transcript_24291/g.61847 Transcript_24291/m.61847 type:complete len:315 (+) Transcript_24291:450-1394(+)